jgi:hypothetical protein
MSYNNLDWDLKQFEQDVSTESLTQNETSNNDQTILFFIDSKNRQLNGENTTFEFEVVVDEENIPGVSKMNSIKKIELIEIIVPDFYINLKEVLFLYNKQIITSNAATTDSNPIRCERLSDLNYLFLSLDRYNNNNNMGTNHSFRNKSFIVKPSNSSSNSSSNSNSNSNSSSSSSSNSGYYLLKDSKYVELGNINQNILADTRTHNVHLIPIYPISIEPDQSANRILNFNVALKTDRDHVLKYLNDSLTINKVTFPSGDSNKLKFEFTELFSSDEYGLGDTIIINPGTLNFNSVLDLESFKTFLERPEGHTIVEHFGASEGVPLGGVSPVTYSKLFKGFYIPNKFNYSNSNIGTYSAANLFAIYDFGIDSGTDLSMASAAKNTENKIINLKNQVLIALKITSGK